MIDEQTQNKIDEYVEIGSISAGLNEGGQQFVNAVATMLKYMKANGFNEKLDPILNDYAGWIELIRDANKTLVMLLEEFDKQEEERKKQEEKEKLDLIPKEIKIDSRIIAQLVKGLLVDYNFSVRVAFDIENIIIQIMYDNPESDIKYHTSQLQTIQVINWESLTSYIKPKFFKPSSNGKFVVGEARIAKTNAIFKNWIETKLRETLAHKYPGYLLVIKYI